MLLYCGQQKEPTRERRQRSRQTSPSRAERCSARPTLLPLCLEVRTGPVSRLTPRRVLHSLLFVLQMGYISSVCSGGQSCAVLADRNVTGLVSAIHELASRERHFYCWLCRVRDVVLAPIRSKGTRQNRRPAFQIAEA